MDDLRFDDDTHQIFSGDAPLVILDRNVLTYGRPEEYVGEDCAFVLPDTFLAELILRARADEDDSEIVKFTKWASKFRDRIWIAKYWRDVSSDESEESLSSLDPLRIIHSELTEEFRASVSSGSFNDYGMLAEHYAEEDQALGQRATDFASMCERTSRRMKEDSMFAKRISDPEERKRWIQGPELVTKAVMDNMTRFSSGPLRIALSQFPDELAAGRWFRLMAWYSVLHCVGKTKGAGNNLFDAEYAFASSYVGSIATEDKGLREAITLIFPACSLLQK